MRNNLREIIRGLFGMASFYWFFIHTDNANIYSFLLIILGSALLPEILVPRRKTKKKSSTKSAAKKKPQNTTNNRNRLSSDQEIMNMALDEMSWREFERLCYLYFEAKGYKPQATSQGADGGVDLILIDKKNYNAKIAVQIKHYKGGKTITVELIRELYAAKNNHKCLFAYFITTSSFTKDALKQADKFKIDTFERSWVENNIIKWKNEKKKAVNL